MSGKGSVTIIRKAARVKSARSYEVFYSARGGGKTATIIHEPSDDTTELYFVFCQVFQNLRGYAGVADDEA